MLVVFRSARKYPDRAPHNAVVASLVFERQEGGTPDRPRKPSPLPLFEALARLGASPQDAIMVGDSAADLHCARNAGVAFVGVTFGYSRLPITILGARVAVDSYSEFGAACDALRDARP